MNRLLLLALVLMPAGLCITDRSAWAQSPYRLEGVVSEAGTGTPVANVDVQVFIVSERDPARRNRAARTDETGHYSVELPAGHAWAFAIIPSAGHCRLYPIPAEQFATTPQQPVVIKNYEVRKGVSLRVKVTYPDGTARPSQMFVAASQNTEKTTVSEHCELGDDDSGTITLPHLSGKFKIGCGDVNGSLQGPTDASAEFEDGFDPQNVRPDGQTEDNGNVVRDVAGRSARLIGCEAQIQGRQLTLVVQAEPSMLTRPGVVHGRIVDRESKGIPDAAIQVAFDRGLGQVLPRRFETITDKNGDFSVNFIRPDAVPAIALLVTCDGYASVVSKSVEVGKSPDEPIDAGVTTLRPGSSIRLKIVGPDDAPLQGAVVEPFNDYAVRKRVERTGPDGECVLTDLPSGLMRISAQFGTLAAFTKVPLEEGENDLLVVKLASVSALEGAEPPARHLALAVGAAAPEWKIAEWTDGKQRKLSDYRGKVVVLDFWGIWCGPCVQMIPVMKKLPDQYKDREVVFLGIHTAGTDMSLVKRLLKLEQWDATVGLDEGDDIASGSTIRSYAIRGFPSVLVVDRNGKIAFNGDQLDEPKAISREMQRIAKAADVPWPIDKDATEKEVIERMSRLQTFMLTEAIDKALEIPAKE